MEDSDLLKDVEIAKLLGFLLVAIRIEVRCLGLVLSTSIFVPNLEARLMSGCCHWLALRDVL